MPEPPASQAFRVDRLRIVRERLRCAREVPDEETDSASATAIVAAGAVWPRPSSLASLV